MLEVYLPHLKRNEKEKKKKKKIGIDTYWALTCLIWDFDQHMQTLEGRKEGGGGVGGKSADIRIDFNVSKQAQILKFYK